MVSFLSMRFDQIWLALEAVARADSNGEYLDAEVLACELGVDVGVASYYLEQIDRCGLAVLDTVTEVPLLLTAGRQYLATNGAVEEDVLVSLANTIDDLHARRALLDGGTLLVSRFRAAIVAGSGLAHAQELVPPAFATAINEAHVPDLFAAAVALTTRLPGDEAPGCVAEEIMMVRLIEVAEGKLATDIEVGRLTRSEAMSARAELRALFSLTGDEDVVELFNMVEPGDAALAASDPVKRQLGVPDQRLESWWRPFGGTVVTGYLQPQTDTAATA